MINALMLCSFTRLQLLGLFTILLLICFKDRCKSVVTLLIQELRLPKSETSCKNTVAMKIIELRH